jgi:undecaprenyl-phosphate 4-deoxy-4-formamido-L-arabinose transferase
MPDTIPCMRDGLTSVVIPSFRSSATLEPLVSRILAACSAGSVEVIIVEDGESSECWGTIQALSRRFPQLRGLRLGRNSGQHGALLAGIREARGQVIVTLDDDLQNPPEEIPRLLAALSEDVDVVYGVPESVNHAASRRMTSRLSKTLLHKTLGFNSAVSISPFRAFRTHLRSSFSGNLGPNVSIDALLTWSTHRFATVTVSHAQRAVGRSNYTTRKLVRFMIDTATGYSTLPLRLATSLGFFMLLFGAAVLVYVISRPLLTGQSVAGFPFLASTITIFAGTQLLVLGILGEYIGRMHFRVMNRPTYFIAERTDEADVA